MRNSDFKLVAFPLFQCRGKGGAKHSPLMELNNFTVSTYWAPHTCALRTIPSPVSQHCIVLSNMTNKLGSCLSTPQNPENNEAFSTPNTYANFTDDIEAPFRDEPWSLCTSTILTLKRNYRNTSMSSQTSKVFSDFKIWPRNLSEITSSEKSPKSQRSSPQQICQGECFAPYVKQNFQMHRYQKMQKPESTEFSKFSNIKVRLIHPKTLDIRDENSIQNIINTQKKLQKYFNVLANIKSFLRFQNMTSKLIRNHVFWKITQISAKLSPANLSRRVLRTICETEFSIASLSTNEIVWKHRISRISEHRCLFVTPQNTRYPR